MIQKSNPHPLRQPHHHQHHQATHNHHPSTLTSTPPSLTLQLASSTTPSTKVPLSVTTKALWLPRLLIQPGRFPFQQFWCRIQHIPLFLVITLDTPTSKASLLTRKLHCSSSAALSTCCSPCTPTSLFAPTLNTCPLSPTHHSLPSCSTSASTSASTTPKKGAQTWCQC